MILKVLELNITKYFIISCIATGIDFSISYFLYKKASLNYIFAANMGILYGFIFQYIASIKYIFKNNKIIKSLLIYGLTFLFGIVLANITIGISFELMKLSFTASKLLSVIVPFFITYFIRKKLLELKSNETKGEKCENLL